jgi:NAD(P)-dependent dehydrogenase (short-subunit alcohol dehydrogenase family)
VSVAGTAQVIRSVLDLLKKSTAPRIINIVADWGFPMHNIMTGPAPYIAAKYAVHGLGAALQTELGVFGIRTTNLCPGVVAADAGYDMPDEQFRNEHGASAIHPRILVDAVRRAAGGRAGPRSCGCARPPLYCVGWGSSSAP